MERWYLTNTEHTSRTLFPLRVWIICWSWQEQMRETQIWLYFIWAVNKRQISLPAVSLAGLLCVLVKPDNNTLSGVQTESFSITEYFRGGLGPHQAGQAVLPGHHGAVRDEAAQLCDDSGQDGKVGTPADIWTSAVDIVPPLDCLTVLLLHCNCATTVSGSL